MKKIVLTALVIASSTISIVNAAVDEALITAYNEVMNAQDNLGRTAKTLNIDLKASERAGKIVYNSNYTPPKNNNDQQTIDAAYEAVAAELKNLVPIVQDYVTTAKKSANKDIVAALQSVTTQETAHNKLKKKLGITGQTDEQKEAQINKLSKNDQKRYYASYDALEAARKRLFDVVGENLR